jgi:hypothetical protein
VRNDPIGDPDVERGRPVPDLMSHSFHCSRRDRRRDPGNTGTREPGRCNTEPGGIVPADYPRTLALTNDNDGFWTFQDAPVRTPTDRRYVPNIGLMQIGLCFNILVGGSSSHLEPWLFPQHTEPEFRWCWPLDAEMGADGQADVRRPVTASRSADRRTAVHTRLLRLIAAPSAAESLRSGR